jgi:hypothetical protein
MVVLLGCHPRGDKSGKFGAKPAYNSSGSREVFDARLETKNFGANGACRNAVWLVAIGR